jgi:hypothetical protein
VPLTAAPPLDADHAQRWTARRAIFRRRAHDFRPRDYEIAPIDRDRVARAFIEQHHYSASYPAAQDRFGLYRGGVLVGVAVFGRSSRDAVLTNVFAAPVEPLRELSRLVLLDEVPFNAESFFVSRCLKALARERQVTGVVSFSDPVLRTTAGGDPVFLGHWGTVYQSLNATFLQRSTPRTLRLLPDARVLSDRAIQKVRAGERGWRAVVALLVGAGAAPCDDAADSAERRAWLQHWLPILTRPLRHPGNFRYAWSLGAPLAMPAGTPYPKRDVA